MALETFDVVYTIAARPDPDVPGMWRGYVLRNGDETMYSRCCSEVEALRWAEGYRSQWCHDHDNPKRVLFVRVDGEIGDGFDDNPPSMTLWQEGVDLERMRDITD